MSLIVGFSLKHIRRQKLGDRVKELCQRLKSETTARQDTSADNKLRLRILDYFIARDFPDDMFEEVLKAKARLNEPDPTKEQSKVICAQILEAWRTK